MQAVRIDMDRSASLWSDFQRQRNTPPASVTSETAVDDTTPCSIIDESNIGMEILKTMGWTAGSGLGTECQGRTSPIAVVQRPKYLGTVLNSNFIVSPYGPSVLIYNYKININVI